MNKAKLNDVPTSKCWHISERLSSPLYFANKTKFTPTLQASNSLGIFTEQDYYEGVIDPENGADWNQTSPIDTKPTVEDFKKTVSDYLAWEVSTLLKNQPSENERLGK